MVIAFCLLTYLTGIVQVVTSNTTSPTVPPSACDYATRSVWSILLSCTLTLWICVWRTIHPNITAKSPGDQSTSSVAYVVVAFLVPEFVIGVALTEWWTARKQVIAFRKKGYEWSMTHSFFAEMGGFTYLDSKDEIKTVRSLEFLALCEAGEIVNPVITVREIKDRSKSDFLAKAILVVQLFQFGLQIVVRAARGLAVTPLELDTVVMALLSLLALYIWLKKPYRPRCPHMFYYAPKKPVSPNLKSVWKSEPSRRSLLMKWVFRAQKTELGGREEETPLLASDIKHIRCRSDRLVDSIDGKGIAAISVFVGWMILGGLHLIAWNFEFPTEAEKILWRVASLALAGSPLLFVLVGILHGGVENTYGYTSFILGIVARIVLAVLMLASLRSLPPSAYQTVPWTTLFRIH